MTKFWTILKYFFVLVVVVVFAAGVYVWRTWDYVYNEIPIPNVHASSDPAIIQRGEYLVFGPAHCVECHSSSFAEFQKITTGARPTLVGGVEFAAAPLG